MHRFAELMENLASLTDCDAVWAAALDFFRANGIAMVSYRHVDPGEKGARFITIRSDGFPDAWLHEYIGRQLHLVDPMPVVAAGLAHPFRWSEIGRLDRLTPSSEAFLEERRRLVGGDGLAMHVFGPAMRNGYFSLGFGAGSALDPLKCEVLYLQCAAQALHLRYCDMVPAVATGLAALSPREREILEWMARGKSNVVIGEILGVSRHTVDTLVRRVFHKLEVNDRTAAAIRGLGAGLLQYHRMA